MLDLEIYVDGLADMQVKSLNLAVETGRKILLKRHNPEYVSKFLFGSAYEVFCLFDDIFKILGYGFGRGGINMLGMTENRQLDNISISELHLSDAALSLLKDRKINTLLLSEH